MQPSSQLLSGRRALDGIRAIEILEDWTRFGKQWALRISIQIAHSSKFVPRVSEWYLLADADYPQGRILVLPAKGNGIIETFHHQRFNGEGSATEPWRSGNICLATNELRSGSLISPIEPWDARYRLKWCAERAVAWVSDAASDKLAVAGQPFELPDFATTDKYGVVGYNEDYSTFATHNFSQCYGLGKLSHATVNRKLLFLHQFSDFDLQMVKEYQWGAASSGQIEAVCWFKLSTLPVIEPWRSPQTYAELSEACRLDGLDLYRVLRAAFMRLGCPSDFIAVAGFPIPEVVGGPLAQMHWQAFRVSGLQNKSGVRNQPEYQWKIHCQTTIGPNRKIEWLASENWSKVQLKSRGRLKISSNQKILLIGAGAVGSIVAENFARGGAEDITIIDPQELAMGNLVRHTLDMSAAGYSKSANLAQRLNYISPHMYARSIMKRFGVKQNARQLIAENYDWVIDCSATDQVPLALSKIKFEKPTRFASFSITKDADKLLLFYAEGNSFDSKEFYELMDPILESEIERLAEEPLPREGIGCWHPVFPGAYHDISALVGFAVKRLEVIATSKRQTQVQVFSNTADGISLFWFAGKGRA